MLIIGFYGKALINNWKTSTIKREALVMKTRICSLLIFVFSLSLLFIIPNTTYSSDTPDALKPIPVAMGDFNKAEYNFTLNSNVVKLTEEDSKKIMSEKIENSEHLNTLFKFERNKKKKLKLKEYKVVFLDTKKSKLEENHYILRIRARMKKRVFSKSCG